MNTRRCTLLLPLLWSVVLCLSAQYIKDPTMEREFAAHVKSTEEFMHRFNGQESFPGLNTKAADFRKQNLFSLLDRDMDPAMKKKANDFVERVLSSGTQLEFCDSSWFALVECDVTYKGKSRKVTLAMRPECHEGKKRRWALCGAKGVMGGLLPKGEASVISPVENEIGFAQLASVFHHDLSNLAGYVADGHEIDPLSAFVALSEAGAVKFNYVSDVKFVFLQVPDFVFTIEELGRAGDNSGWLITVFSELPEQMKSAYLKNILGM